MNQAVQGIISGFEAARAQAAERRRLEAEQQRAAQQQANADRTYELQVLNSLIGLQSQMPKAPDPRVKQAWDMVGQLGGVGPAARIFRGDEPAPAGVDLDEVAYAVGIAAEVDDTLKPIAGAFDTSPAGQTRREIADHEARFGLTRQDTNHALRTGDKTKLLEVMTPDEADAYLGMAGIAYGDSARLGQAAYERKVTTDPRVRDIARQLGDITEEVAGLNEAQGFTVQEQRKNALIEQLHGLYPELAGREELPGDLGVKLKEYKTAVSERSRFVAEQRATAASINATLQKQNANSYLVFGNEKHRDAAREVYGDATHEDFVSALTNERMFSPGKAAVLASAMAEAQGLGDEERLVIQSALSAPGMPGSRPNLSEVLPGVLSSMPAGTEYKGGVGTQVLSGVAGLDPLPQAVKAAGQVNNIVSFNDGLVSYAASMSQLQGARRNGKPEEAVSASRKYEESRDAILASLGGTKLAARTGKTSGAWKAEAAWVADKLVSAKLKKGDEMEAKDYEAVIQSAVGSVRKSLGTKLADDVTDDAIRSYLESVYQQELDTE